MSNDSTYQEPLEKLPPLPLPLEPQILSEYRVPVLTVDTSKVAAKPGDCGCHSNKNPDKKEPEKAEISKAQRYLGQPKCQGDVVVPVYFTTERKPIRDNNGKVTGFSDEPNYVEKDGSVDVEVTRGKIYKKFKVDRGCRATTGQVESIGWKTGMQCMGMKTDEIQTLSEEQYFAELNSSLEKGYTDKIDLFAPGYSIRFTGGVGQASDIELGELRGRKRGDFNSDID